MLVRGEIRKEMVSSLPSGETDTGLGHDGMYVGVGLRYGVQ